MALIDKLTELGNAIREQTGDTTPLTLDAMAVTIRNLNFLKLTPINIIPDTESTFVYDGTAKTPEWRNYDSEQLSISGNTSEINAGTHTVYFTPKAGYCWADESVDSKTVTWTIEKAAGNLSLSATSSFVNGKNLTKTFTVTRIGDGIISVNSSNTSIATATISGNTVTLTSKGYGTATITVSVAEGSNYLAPNNAEYSFFVDYIHLYKNGDKCESVTGGWQDTAWGQAVTLSSLGITYGSNTMSISKSGKNVAFSWGKGTKNAIDLTNINTIAITCNATAQGGGYSTYGMGSYIEMHVGASLNKWTSRTTIVSNGTKNGTVTLDVSSLTGKYHIGLFGYNWADGNSTNSITISDFELRGT